LDFSAIRGDDSEIRIIGKALMNMLNSQRIDAPADRSPREWEYGPGLFDFALGFLRRHYLVIIAVTALGLATGFVLLKVLPPVYTAQAKVLVVTSRAPVVQPQLTADEAPVDLESQMEILKSKVIATSVINQLDLANDPDFTNKSNWFNSAIRLVREVLGGAPQGSKPDPMDELVEQFQARSSATRVGMSNVIDVGFSASSPERAATIANAIVKAFFDEQAKARTDAHRATTVWLHDRLQELSNDALNAERAVNELKTSNNIVSADGKLIDEQQVTALNNRLAAGRMHTSDAMARLNRFDAILSSPNFDGTLDTVPDRVSTGLGSGLGSGLNAPEGQSLASPNNTQIINSLRQQYLDIAKKEYEYSAKYGKDHQIVANLRTQMQSIRQTILDEVRRLAEIARSDFDEAKQQQKEIERQLAQAISQARNTNAAEISIRELETSARGYRSLYDSFAQRYMGSMQQSSFAGVEARVISAATPPQKKSKPEGKFVLALGLLGGLILGTGLGFVREMKDRGFRTSAQIEDRLQVPCLSVVPLLRDRKVKGINRESALAAGQDNEEAGQRILPRHDATCWLASTMPGSRFAESIRAIRLAIDPGPRRAEKKAIKPRSKVIGVTSTLPDEGKSTISASLVQLLAATGKRVILVDCDLRNPSLTATLAPSATAGITDIVSDDHSLKDTIWTDAVTKFDFLPGNRLPSGNTSDMLCNEKLKLLFDELRATYDYVIVDLPPLAPVVDARTIAGLLDRFVLVVEWGRTTADVVEHALNSAPSVYEGLLGVVLNKADMKAMKRYAVYNDYYDHKHYVRYGELAAE
jgi:capsular exopolysaccharide synthesis family protein